VVREESGWTMYSAVDMRPVSVSVHTEAGEYIHPLTIKMSPSHAISTRPLNTPVGTGANLFDFVG